MNEITVYNIGNLPTAPFEHFQELQEDFKLYDPEKNRKLQMLIITRGFKYAFKAWRDPEGALWIIDAHQRKQALLELQRAGFIIPEIPYEPIHASNKQEAVEEIAAYNSEFASKNPDTKLFEKYDIGSDTLERFNLGFDPITLDMERDKRLMAQELGILEDDCPMPDKKRQISKTGDIWILGKHRLMCADSTDPKAIVELMDGRRADLVVTDPPYNVAYEGKTADKLTIQNDSMDAGSFMEFLRRVYKNMYVLLRDGGSFYVFHADSEGLSFRQGLRDAGLKLAQCCIWVKQTFIIGRQDYQWQHEPVLYGWKPTAGHTWYSDRKQSTIWEFKKPLRNDVHPTMKPVGLVAMPIRNSSKEGDLVVDLFAGSGPVLMACEQMNRKAYLMEMDPVYSDVILRRFVASFPDAEIKLIREGTELTKSDIQGL